MDVITFFCKKWAKFIKSNHSFTVLDVMYMDARDIFISKASVESLFTILFGYEAILEYICPNLLSHVFLSFLSIIGHFCHLLPIHWWKI